MKRELSVVIPTYNERENVRILVPRVLDVFAANDIDGEIVIAEDHSTDGSREVLEALSARVPQLRVLFRDLPNSIARAWFDGFSAATKNNIVCIDADLCHDPKYFPMMLDALDEYDMVIGSRYLRNRAESMAGKSPAAIYVSVLGQFLTRIATGFSESDTSHSFRMFKRSVFTGIKDKLHQEGNVFLIDFLFQAKRNGARVTEIPIEYGKRIHGETKLSISKEGFRYLIFISKLMISRVFS